MLSLPLIAADAESKLFPLPLLWLTPVSESVKLTRFGRFLEEGELVAAVPDPGKGSNCCENRRDAPSSIERRTGICGEVDCLVLMLLVKLN